MTKQLALPNYLPSIDRRLEHLAGLPSAGDRSWGTADSPQAQPAARQWLGADFGHTVATRELTKTAN